MCGRIDQDFGALLDFTPLGSWAGRLKLSQTDMELWNKVNRKADLPPSLPMPVISNVNNEYKLELVTWGWHWYQSVNKKKVKRLVSNSRSDTILENLGNPRKVYNQALSHHRCIVPVRRFFEWATIGDTKKTRYEFKLDQEIFGLGGYTTYCSDIIEGEKKAINCGVIITIDAQAQVSPFHDRQPLFIPNSRAEEWLNDDNMASADYLNSFFNAKSPEFQIEALG